MSRKKIIKIFLVIFSVLVLNFNGVFVEITKNEAEAVTPMYNYKKYSLNTNTTYSDGMWSAREESFTGRRTIYSSYVLNSNGTYTGTGTSGENGSWNDAGWYFIVLNSYSQPTYVYKITNSGYNSSSGVYYISAVKKVAFQNRAKTCGSYISTIQASDGTYPDNGPHSDGYWYIKDTPVYNDPVQASALPYAYKINTDYGILTINAVEGKSIFSLNQSLLKSWILTGRQPNNTVTPDKVYFHSKVDLLDSANGVIGTINLFTGKQISFSTLYDNVYYGYHDFFRQIFLEGAGENTVEHTISAAQWNNTKYLKFYAYYTGWWDSRQWSDNQVYEMYFYDSVDTSGANPVFGTRQHTETINFSFNKLPTVQIIEPAINTVYSGQTSSFIPAISVSDPNNNILTCKCFVDAEISPRSAKTVAASSNPSNVTFDTFNISNLNHGAHLLRIEVNDGRGSTYQSIIFKIDKTPPYTSKLSITSTDNSITISGTVKETVSSLASQPYNYTIGSVNSGWISNPSYTRGLLTPDTKYSILFNVKDIKGNISSNPQKYYYTKAKVPNLAVSNPTISTFDITTSDSNPEYTKYQIKIGAYYVDNTGNLISAPTWIALSGKKITIKGLASNTTYYVAAKAKNIAGVETALSTTVTGKTN